MLARVRIQLGVLTIAALIATTLIWLSAQGPVALDADDIGGVVTSANGREAGVWVIAETTDLPTKFARIVVTDDDGRYVVPDLPSASYEVFVRGYGLADSARQTARPGQQLDLRAAVAPDARTAAQVYPAAWWIAMIQSPTAPAEQEEFALNIKECYDCHQIGSKATREILPTMIGRSGSSLDVWTRRTAVGPSGPAMANGFRRFSETDRQRFADWTDRVAAGEAPTVAPPRPAGIERNVVVTLWDWGSPIDGRSDNAASDTRDATVNANGPVYGVAEMTDSLTILDPVEHRATVVKAPSGAQYMVQPFNASPTASPHFGRDVWRRISDVRSVAIDGQRRVWLAARLREIGEQPAWCTSDTNRFGRYYPLERGRKQVAMYDPETEQFSEIDTCFNADHNVLSEDNLLYFGMTGAANESYLAHMDHHDVLGLGEDSAMYGSVNTDAIEVFSSNTGQFVTLRVPYPLGFFPRSANGRIDDPNTGWKGKGLWASYSTYATWHIEGGKGEGGPGVLPKAVKFQIRPDPLAK